MSFFKKIVKKLTASKKVMATLVTGIIAMVAPTARAHGVDISPEMVEQAIIIGSAYVVGQGIADHGKEAEKLRQSIKDQVLRVVEKKVD